MNNEKEIGQEFTEVTEDGLPTLQELFSMFDETYTGESDPVVEEALAMLKEDVENLARE
jgi:hypothetical protein